MSDIETNLQQIVERIKNAVKSSPYKENVKFIAVGKTASLAQITKLHSIGCASFGENRVQALRDKARALSKLNIKWHFIGRLQTNKINQLIDLDPALIHSCDSLELALELDKRAKIKDKKLDILLQINSAKEESKAGVEPKNAIEVYEKILQNCPFLNLKGVMSIGAHSQDTHIIQKSFETTRQIYEKTIPLGAKYCSMGMSNDFELAIKCGSNMLRLGSALFQ
jgi:pyridoxal phosphate enzyme (YggS family)